MPVYYPPATSSSSSGPIITYGIDSRTLNATYGDHFTGGSLDAKWTRRNLTSGNESYAAWGGTYLINNAYGGTIGQSYYQAILKSSSKLCGRIVATLPLGHSSWTVPARGISARNKTIIRGTHGRYRTGCIRQQQMRLRWEC